MFRYFETLIDPYQSYDEKAEFPDRLIPFYFRLLWPARWVILISMALGLIVALVDVLIIYYGAELVDLLATANPGRPWSAGGRTESFCASPSVSFPMTSRGAWRTSSSN